MLERQASSSSGAPRPHLRLWRRVCPGATCTAMSLGLTAPTPCSSPPNARRPGPWFLGPFSRRDGPGGHVFGAWLRTRPTEAMSVTKLQTGLYNSKANPGLEPRRKRGRAGLAVWRESPSCVSGAWVSSGTGLFVGGRRAGSGGRDEMRRPSAPAGPVRPSPNCRILKGTRFQSLHLLSQRIFPVALRQKHLEGT